jgi:hypothetical protein
MSGSGTKCDFAIIQTAYFRRVNESDRGQIYSFHISGTSAGVYRIIIYLVCVKMQILALVRRCTGTGWTTGCSGVRSAGVKEDEYESTWYRGGSRRNTADYHLWHICYIIVCMAHQGLHLLFYGKWQEKLPEYSRDNEKCGRQAVEGVPDKEFEGGRKKSERKVLRLELNT